MPENEDSSFLKNILCYPANKKVFFISVSIQKDANTINLIN